MPVSDSFPSVAQRSPGGLGRLRSAAIWLVALFDSAAILWGTFVNPLPADTPFVQAFAIAATIISFGVVGAFLATRRPRNPIGWLFWSAGLLIFITLLTHLAATRGQAPVGWPSVPPAWLAWLSNETFIAAFLTVVLFVPLLFPDGRLPSPRWRPLAIVMILWLGTAMLAVTFAPGPILSPSFHSLDNPLGITAPRPLGWIVAVGILLAAPVCFAGAALAPVWRYRHGTLVERQQVKWFATATLVTVGAFVVTTLAPGYLTTASYYLTFLSFASIPIAIAIAILRHRLYDVDLLINRTLVYGALTASLATAYVGTIALFQVALRPLTQESQLAVAASTLVVAAMFQPLRARIRRAVDRRFYRTRYDAAKTLETFGARLRSEVDLATLGAAVVGAALDTVQPRLASLWLRERFPTRSADERTQGARS
jgi:hypothetical protein